MKKILSLILIVSLLLMVPISVSYAADSITVAASINNATKEVAISGRITSGQGKTVTIQVISPLGKAVCIDNKTSSENGNYQYSFVLDGSVSGTYIVKVGGDNVKNTVSTTFTYTPAGEEVPVTPTPTQTPGNPPSTGTATPTPTPTPSSSPTPTPTSGSVKVEIKPVLTDKGEALATINSKELEEAFKQAVPGSNGEKVVKLEITAVEGAKEYSVGMPAGAFELRDEQKKIAIDTPLGTITVPGDMFKKKDISNASEVGISIAKVNPEVLDDNTKKKIGNKPVIELNATVDGKTVAWRNNDAPVTVTIDYVPTAEELKDPEHIVVWYIDGKGKPIPVTNAKYDSATGKVTFSTTHFSTYAIVFVKKDFSDLNKYMWAKSQIELLASKGIIEGTSENTFEPNAAISRGEFIDTLIKALDLHTEFDSNFIDVKTSNKYFESIGIARKLEIAKGGGKNTFSPGKTMSRQDMLVFIDRALRVCRKINTNGTAADLKKFLDASKVSNYAVNAVSTMVKEGIAKGSGNKLNPLANATRAEAAQFVYRVYKK